MFRQKPRKNNHGFTLIEVIVAMAILSIVTLMIFSLFGYNLNAFSQSSAAVDEQSSLRLAANKLTNKFRNIGYINLGNGTFADTSAIQAVSSTDHFVFLNGSGLQDGDASSISGISDAEVKSVSFSLRKDEDHYFLGITLSGSTDAYTTEVFLNNIVTNDAVQMDSSDVGASGFNYVQYNYNKPPTVPASPSEPPPAVSVTSVSVKGQNDKDTISTDSGTLQMVAAVIPVNATEKRITWSVSNQNAIIDSSGRLKAISNGSVIVTATAVDNNEISGWAEITITGQSLKLNAPETTVQKGHKYTYTATATGGSPGYSYTIDIISGEGIVSDDHRIVTLDPPKGNKTLKFTVTVTDKDGSTVSTTVTVTATNK